MTAYTGDVRKGPATAVTLDTGVNAIDVWVENSVSDAYNRIKYDLFPKKTNLDLVVT